MPQLLIMRHAKSDWGAGCSDDVDRPLAKRGVKAAKRMGRMLTRIELIPELVLTSPAVRARSTAELAVDAGGWEAPIAVIPSFYGGSWADVVGGVIDMGSSAERLLIVGHEPTWSDLVSVLSGGGRVAMPTAAVACLTLDGSGWSRLGPECARLEWLVTPRMINPLL